MQNCIFRKCQNVGNNLCISVLADESFSPEYSLDDDDDKGMCCFNNFLFLSKTFRSFLSNEGGLNASEKIQQDKGE